MRLTLALGVALLAIIATATAKPSSTGTCSKQEEGATYGIAGDCQKYLVCKKGSLEIKECKSKTSYDTVSGSCVEAGSATCAAETSPEPEPQPEPVPEPEPEESPEQYDYLCQKVLYGVRVYPTACDRFLVCSKEKAAIELCAEGTIFVADFISCVPGDKETCTILSEEPSTTESLPSGSDESEESDESGSDEDSNEAATPEPEPEPQPEPSNPPSEESGSDEQSTEDPGTYDYLCAKIQLGNVAHPESCTKYISCYNYKGKEVSCADGYAYSTKLRQCVKQKNGGCADVPKEPPTTEIATPEPKPEPEPQPEPSNPPSEENESGEDSTEAAGPYDYLCTKTLLGSVAHPDSCTKYISCYKYKGKEETCKKGYAYSTKLHLCVKQKNGGCADAPEEPSTTEAATPEPEPEPEPSNPPSEETESGEDSTEAAGPYDYLCTKTLLGSVAHPDSCTKYISCYKYKGKEETCKKGYAYSSKLHLCVKQKNGGCADAPEEPSTTEAATPEPEPEPEPSNPPSEENESGEDSTEAAGPYDYLCTKTLLGSVAHPDSCTKYISCYKYKGKEETCKKGYAYSSKLHLCVKQKNGGCADAPEEPSTTEAATPEPEPEPEPSNPPSEENESGEDSTEAAGPYDYLCTKTLLGSVAHPDSCTKYISCYKYKGKEETCKKGYAYSSKLHLCVKQKNGGCAEAPEEPSTTEAATPEPEPEPEPSNPPSEENESGEDSTEAAGPYDYLCTKTLLGSVAHPDSCTKYISCYKYKGKEETCKKGYAYSSKLHLCVKQKNGSCADAPEEPSTTEAATPEPEPEPEPSNPPSEETESGEDSTEAAGPYDYLCTKTLLGSVAHPDSCTKYISCYKYKGKEETCKKGYAYSTKLHLCVKQKNGGCADAPEEPSTTEAVTPEPEPQPEPTEEATTTTEVVPPETGGDPGESNNGCVEGFTGFLPIQNDCTSYVYCFQGEPGVRSCLEDYIYYDPFKTCLPGDPVLCQLYSV